MTLQAAVELGLAAISTTPVGCAFRLPERPKAWSVAAFEATQGETATTLRHSPFRLEPLQRFFLPMLDGARTRDDLIAAALDLATRGVLTLSGPDGPITDVAALTEKLQAATDRALAGLIANALIVEE